AGNTNSASTSTDNSVTFNLPDTTRPTVTINQAAGQADPTSTAPINFTVVFSEPVSGFTGTDVTLSGTAGGTKTVTVSGGPSTYTVAVSGMTSSGTVIATIAAGGASDAAGNTNTASTSTDNSVTFNTPAPTIASFTPASGPVGTAVTITGTNFTGTTAVSFNTVSAAFIVDSATSMRAEVPAGATTGPIRVTTPGGTATGGTSSTVTVPAPAITSFTPAGGPAGTVVTITGTNFTGATAVTFNTVSAAFIVDSATSMRAEVPAGATTGPIRVTTPGGTATSASAFTAEASPPPGGTQRFEEDSAAIVASPADAWVRRGPEVAAFSGGTAGSSDVSGATVTFSFTGTAVSWIGLRCSVCGIASVSIDGGAATSVDTAGPAAPGSAGLTSEVVFTTSSLAAGTHTIVITVTGTTTSGGAQIVVDAFD